MSIKFNPIVSNNINNKNYSFGKSLKDYGTIEQNYVSDKAMLKRTKEAFFSTSFIVLGVCFLYFRAKRRINIFSRINDEAKKYETMS